MNYLFEILNIRKLINNDIKLTELKELEKEILSDIEELEEMI